MRYDDYIYIHTQCGAHYCNLASLEKAESQSFPEIMQISWRTKKKMLIKDISPLVFVLVSTCTRAFEKCSNIKFSAESRSLAAADI